MNILVPLLHLSCVLRFTANAEQQAEDQQGRTARTIHSALRSRPSIDRPPAFPGSLNDVIDGGPSAPDLQPPANVRTIYEFQEEVPRWTGRDPPSYERVAPEETSNNHGATANFDGSNKNVVPNAPSNLRSFRWPTYPTHMRLITSKNRKFYDKRDRIADSNEIDIKDAIFRVLSKLISESYASPHSTSLNSIRPDGSYTQDMVSKSLQRLVTNDGTYQLEEPPRLQSDMQSAKRDTERSGSSNPMDMYSSKDHQISYPQKRSNFITGSEQGKNYVRQSLQEILTPPPRFWMSDEREDTSPFYKTILKQEKTNPFGDVRNPFEGYLYRPLHFSKYSQPEITTAFEDLKNKISRNNIEPELKNDEEYRIHKEKQPVTITLDIQEDRTDIKGQQRRIDLIHNKRGNPEPIESIVMQLKEEIQQVIEELLKKKIEFQQTERDEKDTDALNENTGKFNKYIPHNVNPYFPFVDQLEELHPIKKYIKAHPLIDKKMIKYNGSYMETPKSSVTTSGEENIFSDKIKHDAETFPINEYQNIWQPAAEVQATSSSSYFKVPQHYMEKIGKFLNDFQKLYSNPISEKDSRNVKMTLTQDYLSLIPGVVEEIEAGGGLAPGKHEGGGLKLKIHKTES